MATKPLAAKSSPGLTRQVRYDDTRQFGSDLIVPPFYRTRFRDTVCRVGTHCVDSTYVTTMKKSTLKAQASTETFSLVSKAAKGAFRPSQAFLCIGNSHAATMHSATTPYCAFC